MNKLIICLLTGISLQAYATDSVNKLCEVTYFSLGFNGFAGKKSAGQLYYEEIMRSAKESTGIFKEILTSNTATNEAKLYAACGVWRTDRGWLNAYTPADGSVTVLQGDILRKAHFSDLLSQIKHHGCDI